MNQLTRVHRAPPRIAPSRNSLAASYAALTADPSEHGIQILSDVPFGHEICLAHDDGMAPLVRAGDIVVYDMEDCLPADDALFVIEHPGMRGGIPGGPTGRSVVEVFAKTISGKEGWWSASHRLPRTAADHQRLDRQRLIHVADGPYDFDKMMDRIIGRVVGILKSGEIGDVHG